MPRRARRRQGRPDRVFHRPHPGGHVDRNVIKIYNKHGYADENKVMWEALGERILEIVEGRGPDSNVVALR